MKAVSNTKFENVKVGDVLKWTPRYGSKICIVIEKTEYNVTARYITKYGGYCKCFFSPRDFIIRRYTLMNVAV
jgi:hypothetical protein